MPIKIEWFNDEKTILLETFEGRWTVDEYRQLIDQAAELLAEVDHTVDIIADGTDNGPRLPANLLRGGLVYAVRHVPPNQGITVFVRIDAVTETFVNIARNISPRLQKTLFTADNLDQALNLITQHQSQAG